MAGLASLVSKTRTQIGEQRTNALIAELDAAGDVIPESLRRLQYFPESISDSKAINIQKKEIPGASLPVYQWVNSGERLISFSAAFTTDTVLTDPGPTLRSELVDRQKSQAIDNRNVDIRSSVAWLRRFLLPEYVQGGNEIGVALAKAPPRLQFSLLGSGIGLAGGADHDLFDKDTVTGLLTQCDITWEAWFPSGLPRIIQVQISLVEIAQSGSRVSFPRRGARVGTTGSMEAAIDGNLESYAGYRLADNSTERQ